MKAARNSTKLHRTTFKTTREAQYVEARTLMSMTGQVSSKFADVVVKELMDNALDACEAAGVAPEITLSVENGSDGHAAITVSDNAGGIPSETVHGTLDFGVFVSDKAAYRSPTRGAQGNALKTVFGIPCALGSLEPVVVEAKGTRHEARVWKDPAGQLRVQCDDTDLDGPERTHGTAITAHVPHKGRIFAHGPEYWARAFSLFNPHSEIRIRRFLGLDGARNLGKSGLPVFEDSYRPTRDPGKRFKYLPSDPTSPHWYDEDAFGRLVYSHIGHHRHEHGDDLRLREFVRQFKGLSATAKAKAVCDQFPEIMMLSDFEEHAELVGELHDEMQRHTDAPSHNTLGFVGNEHFKERFEEFYDGLYRYDYKKITGTLPTGMPYVFEFAIAEVEGDGDLFTAVNYSPTFDDPLSGVYFSSPKISATGIEEFLNDSFAHPNHIGTYWDDDDPEPPNTAVAGHVITPAPFFLDQGKTRLEGFTGDEGDAIGKAMFSRVKPYLTEGRRRVKGQRTQERAEKVSSAGEKEMSLKDATAAVLEEAWRHTTGGGVLPVGVRRLFYAVRSRIPALTSNRFNPKTGYKYFSQTLLPEYQAQREKDSKERLAGIYYDPRGKLHEPHGGSSVDLGTREVEAYQFPDYVFNKLLYVEKKGQFPLLKAARLMERYDMGIVTGEGFSTVAARTLVQTAQKDQKYQIFVLHDADYPGYNIVRTLRDETARMPGHSVELHDLGLTVEQVLDKDKEPEEYVRSSSIPSDLEPLLSPLEQEWFVGEHIGGKSWNSRRFELDDLTAPETIEHIEDRLKELGVEPKVVPPDDVLAEKREQMYRAKVGGWVDEIIAEMLATDALKEKMAEEFQERFKLRGARAWIETGFKRDDTQSWRNALKDTLQRAHHAKHKADMEASVREYIRETVAGKDDE